ncbi:MAG: sensor histidine kinase, partial [Bacteroidetes bacterium HGW-Bacteroidetes-23]
QFTTNSLLVMVNQVLDFSKNENTHLVLNKKEFDLESELNQMINNLSTLVENSGNVLEVQSNVNERSLVNSDATKIHQLLYNIVGNANKFTDNGIIKLTVNSQKINNKQYHLNFEVRDNGRGISETDLKIIFEGFYKGINSTQINDVGTGLGLNLCKEIVELFGGTITVDSKPMQGTKVAFTILVDSL